jgi:PAS domain S-box-containing protein
VRFPLSTDLRDFFGALVRRHASAGESKRDALGWRALTRPSQLYVVTVIAAGGSLLLTSFPRTFPHPIEFATLLVLSCVTSAWKVNLSLPLSSGSTLSVSYAANLMSLLLLGPRQAMVIAVAGAWTQCVFRVERPYPPYRTVFSVAAEAITIQATSLAYSWLGGTLEPSQLAGLPKVMVGTIATYFFVNTGLVAGAIALSTRQRLWKVWHDNFLWSGPSFMVAGGAGAIGAVLVDRGDLWLSILTLAPAYLTYRSYQIFSGRLEDQRRHFEETQKLHGEAVAALSQAIRAEHALADEKERLSVTLRSIGDGVITTDLDGTILLINRVAENMTGWTQEEAVGRPFATVFRNCDPVTRERCGDAIGTVTRSTDGVGLSRSTVLVARDLTERRIDEIAAPLRDATGCTIGVVVAFRDISDALKLQEERAQASKLASLGLLAGGIAHDFNNILMVIMGNVSTARVTVEPTDPAFTALAEAEKACVRARQLIWQLLTFSKGGVPSKNTVALPRILEESARLALCGSNVSCTFDVKPDLWAVQADEVQLVQMFSNILLNARQAMPQGGTIEACAENVSEPSKRWQHALRVEAGPYVRISIADKGIGIPEEHLNRIFDPYFTTKRQGSGLGLATSYSIIKNHGGYVSVESKLGRGTTVWVNLPASQHSHSREVPEGLHTSASVGSFEGRKGRILVMDDEPSNRTIAVNMLDLLGYDAEVAPDGAMAVEQYKRALKERRPFDAVMLDLIVPRGMGGKETQEHLVGIDPTVKTIVVSGYTQERVLAELQHSRIKAIIAKPFTLGELNSTLYSVVGTGSWTVH